MTYEKLYTEAENLLYHHEITLGEFDRMIKPLREEVQIWIPVTDHLPDKEDWYLVTEVDNSFITVNMRLWVKEGWIVPKSIESKYKVLAWMPLPEPWKEISE